MTTRTRLWFKLLDMANNSDETDVYPVILIVGIVILLGSAILSLFI